MKIIADNKIPFLKGVFEPFCEIDYLAGNKIDREDVLDADVLIVRTRTFCNKKLLEGTKVKFIASATIGFDHIDVDYCREAGIKWVNSPGCNANSVKQWILAALLEFAELQNVNLSERCIGIVGVGNVGSRVLNIAEALGIRVLLNDPPRERNEGKCGFVSIETIIKECDIITFHVPLNRTDIDKTYHLVNDNFLGKVNMGTLVINSSRGEVVETAALLKAIENGIITKPCLDVWENEPNINLTLMNNCLLATPHIAGYSLEGKAKGTEMSVRAVSEFLGLPLTDWEPEIEGERPIIKIDAKGKSFLQVCSEAVKHTYDIMKDVDQLKDSPEKFEQLRGNYPVRHEPSFYHIELINDGGKHKERFEAIGFRML